MSQPAHRTLHRCSETTKIAGAIAWAVGSSKTSTLALGSQISRIIISVQQPGALSVSAGAHPAVHSVRVQPCSIQGPLSNE